MASDLNRHIPMVPVYVLEGAHEVLPIWYPRGLSEGNTSPSSTHMCRKVPMWDPKGHAMWGRN